MKKLIKICAFILVVVLMLSCCACKKTDDGTMCKVKYSVINGSFVDFQYKRSNPKFDTNKVFYDQKQLDYFINNTIKKRYENKDAIMKKFNEYSKEWFESHTLYYTEIAENSEGITYKINGVKKYKLVNGKLCVEILSERHDDWPLMSTESEENYIIFVEFNKDDVKDVPSDAFSMSIEDTNSKT